jgi:hypothetical protein
MIMLFGSQQDYDSMMGKPTGKPAMPAEQIAALHAHMIELHERLAESGVLVDARGLTAPVHARRVRVADKAPVVTDGPYPETQEVLAGYTIIECDSYDRAVEIAAEFINPDAPGEYVDVRPVAEGHDNFDI